jgi:lipopolysaccharide export system protein LptA
LLSCSPAPRPAALLALLLPCAAAAAQESATGTAAAAQQPIEITAEGGIEWDRNAQTYVARGAAQARRGELSVAADTLTAHYR